VSSTLAGTVAFTGLAEQRALRRVGARLRRPLRRRRTSGLQQLVALPDRERIKLLEDQGAAGPAAAGAPGRRAGPLHRRHERAFQGDRPVQRDRHRHPVRRPAAHRPDRPCRRRQGHVRPARLERRSSGAARYPIARDGVQIATPETRNYRDTTVTIGSTHAYQVATEDAYGQRSGYGPAVSAFIDPALNTAPTIEIRTWPPAIPTNGTALLRVNATDTDAETLALALSIDRGNLAPTDDPSLWIVTV
jgi:hypothetical protein